jgi:hypothetical protein
LLQCPSAGPLSALAGSDPEVVVQEEQEYHWHQYLLQMYLLQRLL